MSTAITASGDDAIEISVDGFELVANLLEELARHEAEVSLDRAMQEACSTFAEGVLLPAVRAEAPVSSGRLRDALDWWEEHRTNGAAAAVGLGISYFDNFQGPLFYAGFQEFGWKQGKRPQVPPDAFLRRTLYRHESAFEAHVERHLAEWVRKTRAL